MTLNQNKKRAADWRKYNRWKLDWELCKDPERKDNIARRINRLVDEMDRAYNGGKLQSTKP